MVVFMVKWAITTMPAMMDPILFGTQTSGEPTGLGLISEDITALIEVLILSIYV
jgi:hypothetical protein